MISSSSILRSQRNIHNIRVLRTIVRPMIPLSNSKIIRLSRPYNLAFRTRTIRVDPRIIARPTPLLLCDLIVLTITRLRMTTTRHFIISSIPNRSHVLRHHPMNRTCHFRDKSKSFVRVTLIRQVPQTIASRACNINKVFSMIQNNRGNSFHLVPRPYIP